MSLPEDTSPRHIFATGFNEEAAEFNAHAAGWTEDDMAAIDRRYAEVEAGLFGFAREDTALIASIVFAPPADELDRLAARNAEITAMLDRFDADNAKLAAHLSKYAAWLDAGMPIGGAQ